MGIGRLKALARAIRMLGRCIGILGCICGIWGAIDGIPPAGNIPGLVEAGKLGFGLWASMLIGLSGRVAPRAAKNGDFLPLDGTDGLNITQPPDVG